MWLSCRVLIVHVLCWFFFFFCFIEIKLIYKICVNLRYTTWWFDICLNYKFITIIRLINSLEHFKAGVLTCSSLVKSVDPFYQLPSTQHEFLNTANKRPGLERKLRILQYDSQNIKQSFDIVICILLDCFN